MKAKDRRDSRATGRAVVVALAAAAYVVGSKAALTELGPSVYHAVRASVAAVLLGVVCLGDFDLVPPLLPDRPSRARVRRTVALCAGALFLFEVLFAAGLDRTSAGNAVLILATIPLWGALTGWYLNCGTWGPGRWTGFGLAGLGTLLLVLFGGRVHRDAGPVAGNLLLLLAAFSAGAGGSLARTQLRGVRPQPLALLAVLCTLPLHVGLAAPQLGDALRLGASPTGWITAVAAGVATVALGPLLRVLTTARVRRATGEVVVFGAPVFAVLLGAIAFGEAFTPPQAMAAALVFGGMAMLVKFRQVERIEVEADEDEPLPRLRTVRIVSRRSENERRPRGRRAG